MTALTAGRKTDHSPSALDELSQYLVANSQTIYDGALVGLNAAGLLVPAAAGTAMRIVGRARLESAPSVASGTGGTTYVRVEHGAFWWANGDSIATPTDLLKPAYAQDDQTVTKAVGDGDRPLAGIILAVDATFGVLVQTHPAITALPAGVQRLSLSMTEADLTDADGSQALSIGTIPAGATVLGVAIKGVTAFSGGVASDLTIDVGDATDVDALVDGANAFGAAVINGNASAPAGAYPNKYYATATELFATFICGSDDVADLTAGAATIEVLYIL